MREILFRAKRLDNGKCVYGNLVLSIDVDDEYGTIIIPMEESGMFVKGEDPEEHDLGFENWHLVDPDTICQYTGLTDKNGRKIFEGDIIKDIDYGIMKCIYLHGSFAWYKEDGFKIECMRYVPVIEVIGNIFDNPELVKEVAE